MAEFTVFLVLFVVCCFVFVVVVLFGGERILANDPTPFPGRIGWLAILVTNFVFWGLFQSQALITVVIETLANKDSNGSHIPCVF